MDFALLKPNPQFDLSKYFVFVEKEVKAYGLNLTVSKKDKTQDFNITSAFLKGKKFMINKMSAEQIIMINNISETAKLVIMNIIWKFSHNNIKRFIPQT